MPQTADNARRFLIGCLITALAAAGFSAKSIFIKLAYADASQVDAVTLLALRMLLALPFFLLIGLREFRSGSKGMTGREAGVVLLLGFLGYYLASLLDFLGLQYLPAGLERLILFLYPTFVILLNALFDRRPIRPQQGLSLLLGYSGILLVYGGLPQQEIPNLAIGTGLVLGSALSFALYLSLAGRMIPRIGSGRFTAYSMTVACGLVLGHYAAIHPWEARIPDGITPRVALLGAALALISTVMPAFLMNAGIQRIGSGTAAIIGSLGPVSTLLLAWWLLDERLEPLQWLGTAAILTGVWMIGREGKAA